MKPSESKNNEKTIGEKEKSQSENIEKERNLERFIYYTTYNDLNFIEKLNPLFQEINQKAFNLRSPKETFTYALSEEERDNNEIDYISGFQIFDKVSRLTILEGITGKAMKKIKETFPKTQMNSKTFKIFSDSNILFNKRIYSKFDLSLKYIKIRNSLTEILTSFDIYLKSNTYRGIYDAFMNLGSILNAETLKEIAVSNLFPDAESLLLLERKYGDVIKEEDIIGKKEEKKIIKKYSIVSKPVSVTKSTTQALRKRETPFTEGMEELKKNLNSSELIPNENNKNNQLDNNNNINNKKFKKLITRPININLRKGLSVDRKNSPPYSDAYNRHPVQTEPIEKFNKRIISIGPRVIANNRLFKSMLRKRDENFSTESSDVFEKNKEYISNMKRKKRPEKLWKPFFGEYDKSKPINFYAIRNNHYEEVVNQMREKYLKDKNHFYTYSEMALTLSFPMIDKFRNEEYLNYIDNKSKWIVSNDFDRYKQPPREKFYFPKNNKEP